MRRKHGRRNPLLGVAFVVLTTLAVVMAVYDLGHGNTREIAAVGMDASFLRCVYLVRRDTPKLRMH